MKTTNKARQTKYSAVSDIQWLSDKHRDEYYSLKHRIWAKYRSFPHAEASLRQAGSKFTKGVHTVVAGNGKIIAECSTRHMASNIANALMSNAFPVNYSGSTETKSNTLSNKPTKKIGGYMCKSGVYFSIVAYQNCIDNYAEHEKNPNVLQVFYGPEDFKPMYIADD